MDLKDPFFSIIAQLDEIAKDSFRKNKEIPIRILIEPFQDLKKFFQSPQVTSHQDTSTVIKEIDRVISEWETLDSVMRSFPPSILEDTDEGKKEVSS